MVPCYAGSLGSSPSAYTTRLGKSADQRKTTTPAPPSQKVVSFSDSFVGLSLADSGLSAGSTELLSHAWREGTKLQYDTTVRRWGAYCRKCKIDTFTPHIAAVVNFLTSLFEMGLGYGAVASARGVLGNFVTVHGFPWLADHPLVQKLLKGVANARPSKPRYTRIWDTSHLITYLASPTHVLENLCRIDCPFWPVGEYYP